jgi:N-acetylneuraminate synthase
MQQGATMSKAAQIDLSPELETASAHHYGIRNFREFGAVIINCINRQYCKKLIVQLPGQHHPSHFHKRKEETFQVLSGELFVDLDGHKHHLYPGDTLLVQPGVWHEFWTETGVIFEEVSTTHYNDDSFYKDKQINRMERHQGKTVVDNWGRFQLLSEAELVYKEKAVQEQADELGDKDFALSGQDV